MTQTDTTTTASNRERLKNLMLDILLLEPEEFSFDLRRDQVEEWDSLAVVAVAVGVEETFGHHMTQEEAMNIRGVPDIIHYLESKGVSFDD